MITKVTGTPIAIGTDTLTLGSGASTTAIAAVEASGRYFAALGARPALGRFFAATDDEPILFRQGRFFLLHPPGGIIAAYRKCTHLGCAVPFVASEDRFHCPCHGSEYDKRTAVVLKTPAPKPLALFHISQSEDGNLIVDTNPLRAIDRSQRWDPAVIEITDS